MAYEELLADIILEFSGDRAKEDVRRIAGFHRIQGSQGYSQAVDLLRGSLDELGVANKVSAYPADARSRAFSWTAPPAWNIRSGILRQITPGEAVLARFSANQHAIISQSHGGKAEGELVDVGEGISPNDYSDLNVVGKFVMATGKPRFVAPLAVARGAVGVIVYPTASRASEFPDMVVYEGFWPDAEALDSTPLGFSISLRQAAALQSQMMTGPVLLSGAIDAAYGGGELQILDARMPGSQPSLGEVVLVAHLCHPKPSANDNASGSALLLEIARTVVALAQRRQIVPLRSIRLLWVPELYGTLPWAIEHEDEVSRILFALSLDMVGESQDKIGQPFRVGRVPGSTPSFLNAWFEPLLEKIADAPETTADSGSRRPMNWRVAPPSGGSDHLVFSDSRYGIPAAIFGHSDPFHHTHLDNMDMVDATELKRVGILTAMVTLMADTAAADAELLDGWLSRYSSRELYRAASVCHHENSWALPELLKLAVGIEQERARGFGLFLDSVGITWDQERFLTLLLNTRDYLLASSRTSGSDAHSAAIGQRPQRLIDGPLSNNYFRSLPSEKRRYVEENFSGFHGALAQELLNLSDGEHTVHELALRLSLDFNRWIPQNVVANVLRILEEGGWVRM